MFNKLKLLFKKYNFNYFDNLSFEVYPTKYEYNLYYFTIKSNLNMEYVRFDYYAVFNRFRVNVIDGIMECLKLNIDGVRFFIWGACCVPWIFVINTMYLLGDIIILNFCRLVVRLFFRIMIRIPWTVIIYIYIVYFVDIYLCQFFFLINFFFFIFFSFFFFFYFFFFIFHFIFVLYSFIVIWIIFIIFLFLFLFSEFCSIF